MHFLPDASVLHTALMELRRRGLQSQADRLEALIPAWEKAQSETTWLKKNFAKVKALLTRHAENARTEAEGTTHLLKVAKALMVDRTPVTDDEADKAREELLDLVKAVPASAILAGTFFIPIPGAQPILAPILMERLGLLPSAWAESKLVVELRDLVALAREQSLPDLEAALKSALEAVKQRAALQSDLVRFLTEHPEWDIFFDEDLDSRISASELAALQGRIRATARMVTAQPASPLLHAYIHTSSLSADKAQELGAPFRVAEGDLVIGPVGYCALRAHLGPKENALVRTGPEAWWIPWPALVKQVEAHCEESALPAKS